MNTWAAPGVQCVCIEDEFGSFSHGNLSIPTRVPMLNEVLTVRVVVGEGDDAFLGFEEIEDFQSASNGPCAISARIYWDASCFRPLENRKTDISIFTKLLTPAGRIPADA